MKIRAILIAKVAEHPGLTVKDLEVSTGIGNRRTGTALWELMMAGRLFTVACTPYKRYYASQEEADAAAAQCAAETEAHWQMMKDRRRERDATRSKELKAVYQARYQAKKAAGLVKYTKRPKKEPKPIVFANPKPVPIDRVSAFRNQEAYVPPNVKRTVWLTPPDRFDPRLTAELVFSSMRPGQYL